MDSVKNRGFPFADPSSIILPRDLVSELKVEFFFEQPNEIQDPISYCYRLKQSDAVKENHKLLVNLMLDLDREISSVA